MTDLAVFFKDLVENSVAMMNSKRLNIFAKENPVLKISHAKNRKARKEKTICPKNSAQATTNSTKSKSEQFTDQTEIRYSNHVLQKQLFGIFSQHSNHSKNNFNFHDFQIISHHIDSISITSM